MEKYDIMWKDQITPLLKYCMMRILQYVLIKIKQNQQNIENIHEQTHVSLAPALFLYIILFYLFFFHMFYLQKLEYIIPNLICTINFKLHL